MKQLIHKKWVMLLLPFGTALLTTLLLLLLIPKAQPYFNTQNTGNTNKNDKEILKYVAIGDSLTEGVGDLTNSGGFVPMVAKDIQEKYQLNAVEIENFGKNGDRSDQILKRIKKSDDIKAQLGEADMITLTVGGNDLMKVIKGDVFNLTIDSFDKPLESYQKQMTTLLEEIRKYNEDAPVYVLGIYNPFYLYFPEITEMQQIVTNWNAGTETVVNEQERMYFIPINDLLYKGVDGDVGITGSEDDTADAGESITNNAIYEEDHFHPNNLGYQLMANAVRQKMIETKDEWLVKGVNE
ncbi:SGNH/GDSL hydrolase family protein [Enterococcus sp. BWM-S5]|uniref:SGNH/GDSL hydrolase family protein n=1 Tax=Enterococcus larvae TaxID=2794352 RepID=A0ABS4CGR5_9ENTE|nr:SGNH/GDSL hydrolase family protein [Enterococcus larvae]MBP1045798.1 SGNH/GDSL hydrolase family protein [Enterococcus larvae]